VEVPADDTIKMVILASRHNSRLAGHPGRAWTLALVRRCFTWPSMKKFVNRYVDGCKSCQRAKTSTQAPFGTLELLPIPAGQWTDVSNNLITDLPKSNGFDSILTVFDRLTKMAHFTPCEKAMSAEGLADLMLRNVWRLHGTPKSIILDCGSIFISQIMQRTPPETRNTPTAIHGRMDNQKSPTRRLNSTFGTSPTNGRTTGTTSWQWQSLRTTTTHIHPQGRLRSRPTMATN
jgi:hypothetical protein